MPDSDESGIKSVDSNGGPIVAPDSVESNDAPAPKRRGRPRLSPAPESGAGAANGSGNGSATTKRGRISTTRAKTEIQSAISADSLAGILLITHTALAGFTGIPEIELESDDAGELSTATVNLLEQYDISVDPKLAAGIILFGVASKVYAPKVIMYKMRIADEKEKQRALAEI